MNESHGGQRYSRKAKTLEAPATNWAMRCLLGMSITVQILCSLSMSFIGIYAFTACSNDIPGDFAGVTPVTSGIYCVLASILAIFVCKTWRMASVIVGVVNFVIASIGVVYEAASLRCTQKGAITQFCEQMRSSLNGCRWMNPSSEKETKIPVDDNASLRYPLLILAVVAILGSITTMIFLFFAIKIGKPVYLALKRHKSSIVVGQAKNAEEANVNKLKNIEIVMARLQEEDGYDRKKKERLLEYYSNKRKSVVAKQAFDAGSLRGGEGSKRDMGSTVSTKRDKSSPGPSTADGQLLQNISGSAAKNDSKTQQKVS